MILGPSQPPLNFLGLPMRQALGQALTDAIAAPDISAIVLTALGTQDGVHARGLSAGLPLQEAADGFGPPTAGDICQIIEQSETPVVAVLHGVTLGAGVELALAAHARLGTGEAMIGFPDVMMGLCPGAGATQRLPRILGVPQTLDLLLSQHPRLLRARPLRPLVDRMVPEGEAGAVIDAAVTLAQELSLAVAAAVAAGEGVRRIRDLRDGLSDFAANASAIAARRAQVASSPNSAGARIVDCVEAACLLPFEAGLAFEATAFEDLLRSDMSRSLRHVAFAEARAANMPECDRAAPLPVRQVAVIGGGVQGAQLAAACLAAGVQVVHFERSDTALKALQERLAAAQAAMVRAGRLTADAAKADRARWRGTMQLSDLVAAEVLIEAVADTLPTKTQVMAALDRLAIKDAVLVTTSALLDIDAIAKATARPANVLGLRLPAPAHLSRLAEVIPGSATADAAVATLAAFLRDGLGRVVLRSGTGGGSLGEPVLAALHAAAAGLLRLGVSVQRIDAALQDYGFGQGIFRQMDQTGLEGALARGRMAAARVACGTQHLEDLDRLIMAGRVGQAAGRGFYLWQDGQAQPDRAVAALLDLPGSANPSENGPDTAICAAPLSDKAIMLRMIAAMANAGARALRAGLALRPSDIDTVMVLAHGYPRWHGGPMQAADLVGLFDILQAMRRFAIEDPALYTPDPGFAALVKEGETFGDLNQTDAAPRRIPG